MPEQTPNEPQPGGSDRPGRSEQPARPRRLRPSGGYRKLRSYQVATLIYDGTVKFCDRFVDKRSRTHDQMVQAARSGGKNIAEGSRAAATTSQTELRLVWGCSGYPECKGTRSLEGSGGSDRSDRSNRGQP